MLNIAVLAKAKSSLTGENARPLGSPEGTEITATHAPLATCQIRIVAGFATRPVNDSPEASSVPSCENASHCTQPLWPKRALRSVASVFHNRTEPSQLPAVATTSP